jgi:hypothetical protein
LEDAVYAVHLEVPAGDVFHVAGEGGVRESCDRPCVLRLPRGIYKVTSRAASTELILESPVRIEQRGGSKGLQTTGVVLAVAGLVVTAAAVAVPIVVCRTGPLQVDQFGRTYQSENPCRDLSTPIVIGWVSTLTAGFGALVVGGFLLLTAGPYLKTTDVERDEREKSGRVRVLPLVAPNVAGLGVQMTF